jgi:hypothetical protein
MTITPGTIVWLVLAAMLVSWLTVLAVTSGRFAGPRRVLRWLIGSWLSRCVILAAWGAAGWHIFCQRP